MYKSNAHKIYANFEAKWIMAKLSPENTPHRPPFYTTTTHEIKVTVRWVIKLLTLNQKTGKRKKIKRATQTKETHTVSSKELYFGE